MNGFFLKCAYFGLICGTLIFLWHRGESPEKAQMSQWFSAIVTSFLVWVVLDGIKAYLKRRRMRQEKAESVERNEQHD